MQTPAQKSGLRRAELESKLAELRVSIEDLKMRFDYTARGIIQDKDVAIGAIALDLGKAQSEEQQLINILNHLPPAT